MNQQNLIKLLSVLVTIIAASFVSLVVYLDENTSKLVINYEINNSVPLSIKDGYKVIDFNNNNFSIQLSLS